MSDHYDATTGRLLDEPDGVYSEDVKNCNGCRVEWDEQSSARDLPRIVYCADHAGEERLDLLALCHDAIQGLLQEAGVWTDDWNALVVELHDPEWADLKPRLDAALADYWQEQENARVDAGL